MRPQLCLPVLLFAAVSLSAQPAPTPACGDPSERFHIHKAKAPLPSAAPEGQALVVFLTDGSAYNYVPAPATRAGLDGQWQGATHGNGAFSFAVAPGAHHLCSSWEPFAVNGLMGGLNVAHGYLQRTLDFTAEPGRVYYFLVRNTYGQGDQPNSGGAMTLSLLDPAEAAKQLAASTSTTSQLVVAKVPKPKEQSFGPPVGKAGFNNAEAKPESKAAPSSSATPVPALAPAAAAPASPAPSAPSVPATTAAHPPPAAPAAAPASPTAANTPQAAKSKQKTGEKSYFGGLIKRRDPAAPSTTPPPEDNTGK